MPSSLNTTFNAAKDNIGSAKAQDQLREPSLLAKYHTNDLEKEDTRYALRNNHSQIFKEVELKRTLLDLKSRLKTEDNPTHMCNIKSVKDEGDKELFRFSTPNRDNEIVTPSDYLLSKEQSQSKRNFLNSYKQESFESDDFMDSPKMSSSVMPSLTCTHKPLNMNFLMLIGLLTGLLVSKLLNYVEVLLMWLTRKILQMRNYLMGTTSVWQFLNLDATNRLQVTRTNLILLPVIALCCFIYNLIDILHFTVRFLLSAVPNNLIQLVQNFYE